MEKKMTQNQKKIEALINRMEKMIDVVNSFVYSEKPMCEPLNIDLKELHVKREAKDV